MSPRAREATRRRASRARRPEPRVRPGAGRRTGARARPPATPTWRVSSSGARFGLFAWKYLRHTKGRAYKGKPFALEPFELLTFSELLEVENDVWLDLTDRDAAQAVKDPAAFWARIEKWRNEEGADAHGLRLHREGLWGISKKNGKSTSSSGFALYLLVADGEPGAEVYSTASTKEQARIVFRQATEMAQASPALLPHIRCLANMIVRRDDGSFYKVVSADAGGLEGINPHGVVNDEIHAHKKRDLYDTLRSATIGRDQPILLSITTAGVTVKGTIGGELYERGAGKKPALEVRHEAGVDVSVVKPHRRKQRSFYFRWYQADRKKLIDTKGRINVHEAKLANPASWITIAKLIEEAEIERPLGIFLRYHANIWSRVEAHWLRPGAWEACRGKAGDEDALEDRQGGEEEINPGDAVIVTVDIGLHHDATSVSVTRPPRLGRLDDPEDPIATRAWVKAVWPDPKTPPPPAHEHLEGQGPLDLDEIMDHVLELCTTYRVLAVAADPYKFEYQLQALEKLGIFAVRFDQGKAMTRASETLYRVIHNRLLAHDGDEVLETHMENAVARDAGGGHWRLDKKKATELMDAAVSTAMGVDLCHNEDIAHARRPSATRL